MFAIYTTKDLGKSAAINYLILRCADLMRFDREPYSYNGDNKVYRVSFPVVENGIDLRDFNITRDRYAVGVYDSFHGCVIVFDLNTSIEHMAKAIATYLYG